MYMDWIARFIEIADATWRMRRPLSAARGVLLREGVNPCPMGDSDSKTLLPGFYRGIGVDGQGTCPVDCPYLPRHWRDQGPCYAANYHCSMCAKRAPIALLSVLASFVMTSHLAMRRDRHPARGWISGDCCREGRRDHLLLWWLCVAADALAAHLGTSRPVAYGYSHVQEPGLYELLRGHHIAMLRSDWIGPGGAVVWPVDHIDALRERHPDQRFVACLHATEGYPCRVCSLCHKAPDKGHCVVLEPSGTWRKRIRQQILESIN